MERIVSIRKVTGIDAMLEHYELIKQLTPTLSYAAYESMLADMLPHNYYQVAAYEGDVCLAVSGFWIGTKIYSGKYLEIDNFVVAEQHRSKGIGKIMLDWLTAEAKAQHCETIMLDAYVENFKAHHFYYREGFIARGFHYLKKI